jgi:hypothetical protein
MKPDRNPISEAPKSEGPICDGHDAQEIVVREIMRAITGVRFGSVEITIHDSRIVQIERKEKVRFVPAHRAGVG